MAWTPAQKKSHPDFIKEARYHCKNSIRNIAVGRWLDAALSRMEALIAENARLQAIVDRYRQHLALMQADATNYLVPDMTECNQAWFVSRMLWHLDGPDQRAIEPAASETAEAARKANT